MIETIAQASDVASGPEYALGRTQQEYQRLRTQAQFWEQATEGLFDRLDMPAGASCLDAGSGPGEVMRLLSRRVGPAGSVTGLDVDAALNAIVQADLRSAGLEQCSTITARLGGDAPVPGGPYDLVYARLLLFHVPEQVAVLRRLWDAVAPGGYLVVQDYDLLAAGTASALPGVEQVTRLIFEAFTAVGCDIRAGLRLPELFSAAGIGELDGNDIAGRLVPLPQRSAMLEQVLRSLVPAAIAHGVTTAPRPTRRSRRCRPRPRTARQRPCSGHC